MLCFQLFDLISSRKCHYHHIVKQRKDEHFIYIIFCLLTHNTEKIQTNNLNGKLVEKGNGRIMNVLLVYVDEIVIMKHSRYGVLLTTQKFVESNEIL